VFNLFGLFGKDEVDSSLENKIAELVPVLKIDATNSRLETVKNFYQVKSTPYIVLINKNKAVLQE
jgi:hypothetical protein